MTKLYECISSLGIHTLTERFEMLKQLGNLFIVKLENLKTVISEEYLRSIELQFIVPYSMLRVDWTKFEGLQKNLLSNNAKVI